jgi:hypothetical protein
MVSNISDSAGFAGTRGYPYSHHYSDSYAQSKTDTGSYCNKKADADSGQNATP